MIKKSFEKYMDDVDAMFSPTPQSKKIKGFFAPPDEMEGGSSSPSRRRDYALEGMTYLSDALFAYETIRELCHIEAKESRSEALKFLDLFLNFLFEVCHDLERKEDSLKRHSLQKMVRFMELKKFVRDEFFFNYLEFYVTWAGAQGLIEILRDKKRDLRMRDFGEALWRLCSEKSSIKGVRGKIVLKTRKC